MLRSHYKPVSLASRMAPELRAYVVTQCNICLLKCLRGHLTALCRCRFLPLHCAAENLLCAGTFHSRFTPLFYGERCLVWRGEATRPRPHISRGWYHQAHPSSVDSKASGLSSTPAVPHSGSFKSRGTFFQGAASHKFSEASCPALL